MFGVWGAAAAAVVELVFTVDVRIVVEFLFLSKVGLRTPALSALLPRCGGMGGESGVVVVPSSIGLVYCWKGRKEVVESWFELWDRKVKVYFTAIAIECVFLNQISVKMMMKIIDIKH